VAETSTLQVYRALLGSRLAAQTAYRRSFAFELAGQLWLGVVDLAEILVIFGQVPVLGGLDLDACLLVFALATLGFSLADMAVGHLDDLPSYVRSGRLDALMLRPLPLLAQLVVEDLSLRRLGRAVTATAVLAVALARVDVDWTPARAVLVVLAPLAGAAVFSAVFVAGGAIAFWLVEGRELANAFTYGGHYVAEFPLGALALPLRRFFTFVVPAAFTAYLPALAILGRPDPTGLPDWLAWCSPVAALAAWTLGALVWRAGVRAYVGAGS
jgi:ABC-2 type transport system permease protein